MLVLEREYSILQVLLQYFAMRSSGTMIRMVFPLRKKIKNRASYTVKWEKEACQKQLPIQQVFIYIGQYEHCKIKAVTFSPLQEVSSWGLRNRVGNVTIPNLQVTGDLGRGRHAILLNKQMIRDLSGGLAFPSCNRSRPLYSFFHYKKLPQSSSVFSTKKKVTTKSAIKQTEKQQTPQ